MKEPAHLLYEFSGFQLDPEERTLMRNGEPVVLTPKGFDTLLFLVQNGGKVLTKDELMKALWPESFVEEGNLSQNIFVLRKVLGDDRNGHSFIQTIPRRGYKFVAAVRELPASAEAATESASARDYWSRHSPFRGLQAFEPNDAWLFFGREAETEELLARLSRFPVLAVIGNSGCGKSSLVRAGLIPALGNGQFQDGNGSADSCTTWRVAIVRPSSSPFDHLAEVLPSQLVPELSLGEQVAFISECRSRLHLGGEALRDAITALVHAAPEQSQRTRVLLVVDQFEELFTLTADCRLPRSPMRAGVACSGAEVRERYIDALLAASRWDASVPVHLVLVLRADFYPHCLEHRGLSRCLGNNLYNVPRMTCEQLRQTIEKRLALAGAGAEAGLIDTLLDEVGTEPGDLALLEHALSRLWESGGSGRTLTNEAYSAIGRLRGALSAHADRVYAEIPGEEQKRLAQKIFLELIHIGEGAPDTRRRVRKESLLALGTPEEVEALLARLASSRLICVSGVGENGESEDNFVEVSHEALIREWSSLREWIAQNREEIRLERRLVQAAQEWEGLKRDPGALLQGARLAQAEEWLARHPTAPATVRELVHASRSAHTEASERELRRQKAAAIRLRWFSGALAGLLLVGLGSQNDWILRLIGKVQAILNGGRFWQVVYWSPLLGRAALAGMLFRRRLVRRFPLFFSFILIAWLRDVACFAVYYTNPGGWSSRSYWWTYWISHLATALAGSLAAYELAFVPVLWHSRAVIYRNLFLVVTFVCAFAAFWRPSVSFGPLASAINVLNISQVIGLIFFVGLMTFKGRRWSRSEFAIAVGLSIYAVAFLVFFGAFLKSGPVHGITRELPALADFLACVVWLVSFWRPEMPVDVPSCGQHIIANDPDRAVREFGVPRIAKTSGTIAQAGLRS